MVTIKSCVQSILTIVLISLIYFYYHPSVMNEQEGCQYEDVLICSHQASLDYLDNNDNDVLIRKDESTFSNMEAIMASSSVKCFDLDFFICRSGEYIIGHPFLLEQKYNLTTSIELLSYNEITAKAVQYSKQNFKRLDTLQFLVNNVLMRKDADNIQLTLEPKGRLANDILLLNQCLRSIKSYSDFNHWPNQVTFVIGDTTIAAKVKIMFPTIQLAFPIRDRIESKFCPKLTIDLEGAITEFNKLATIYNMWVPSIKCIGFFPQFYQYILSKNKHVSSWLVDDTDELIKAAPFSSSIISNNPLQIQQQCTKQRSKQV